MKKLLLLLIFFFYFKCYSQDFKGVWLYDGHKVGTMNKKNLDNGSLDDMPLAAKPSPWDNKFYSHPSLKGVLLFIGWSTIQDKFGVYHWDYLDNAINDILTVKSSLKIGISIWTGKYASDWVFASGIHSFHVLGDGYYPDYLDKFNHNGLNSYSASVNDASTTPYETLWRNMITALMAHLNANYNSNLIFIQSAEGSTGDLAPYHGDIDPNDAIYDIENNDHPDPNNPGHLYNNGGYSEWQLFVKRCWGYTASKIKNSPNLVDKLNLLLNTGATGDVFDNVDLNNPVISPTQLNKVSDQSIFNWVTNASYIAPNTDINTYLAKSWRKADGEGHWYQLNYEQYFAKAFNDLKATNSTICTRDEFDISNIIEQNADLTYVRPIGSTGANASNVYATAASALNANLDIWCILPKQLYDESGNEITNNTEVYNMFNSLKKTKIQTTDPTLVYGAYCFLKDGLDANDYSRFTSLQPTISLPSGCNQAATTPAFDKNDPDNCGEKWTKKIVPNTSTTNPFYLNGAVQKDKTYAQGAPSHQYLGVTNYNDVGWYTFNSSVTVDGVTTSSNGNQGYFLNQIIPGQTSFGSWNSGAVTKYGRFARQISGQSTNTNALYFNVADNLSANVVPYNNRVYKINVIYYDNGDGSTWQLYYNYNQTYPEFKVTNGSGTQPKWKIVTFSNGTCLNFINFGPNNADFWIKNTDEKADKFAFVSVTTVNDPNPSCTPTATYQTTLFPSLLSGNQSIVSTNNAISNRLNTSLASVYPNPSKDYTSITFNSNHSQCNLTLSNIQGKPLYQKTLPQVNKGMNQKISLQGFAKGIYLLKISCDDAAVQTEKIVVE